MKSLQDLNYKITVAITLYNCLWVKTTF